ncbi:alpha/beta fold hydrolase [Pseudonocardia petroleophila]|uniref:Alpha/beta fold hydrolase n=1 Tax=Pseudonocardia petroleophila TaxID=37331 RepID=A0A7G7MFD0_9PSEU|nr:alpha/beta fold hydrolase [Pseudonocardia petroleophila]QNG51491.1 alpha/beta fold hydrolase [Pseudonocardia petroleophila]
MPRLPRVLLLALVLLTVLPATAYASTPGAAVTEERVDVPGATLDTTLYLPATTPAPAVLVAHGFGGSKDSVDADARALAERGFVVLAWSARGFGASTGQIGLNAPDAEVADASALLDRLAAMPEVVQDGPGDPRVGVTGASYGGALSLLLAGYDPRVDAIAPVITWNDLGQALFPNAAATTAPPADTAARGAFAPDGVFKRGWAGVFFSAGLGAGSAGADTGSDATTGSDSTTGSDATGPAPGAGAAAPAGADPVCGRFTAEVCAAYTDAATTGRLSTTTAALLERSSPRTVTDRITAPTLLVQGERDTLFGLDQADANARQIAANGTPVQVRWYAGGHDGGAPDDGVRTAVGDWFSWYLTGTGEDPGTAFPYAVESGIRAGSNTPTGRTVVAAGYPGLPGTGALGTQVLPLDGDPAVVATPAGGSPAAITALPGLGGALGSLSGRISSLTSALPGQSAQFTSAPLADPLLVTGAPRVDLTVARVAGRPGPADAILFVSTSEVTPDGTRTLLGSAVAPVRVAVPADGSAATATVTLPGVVAPVEAGNRLVVTVATTDQAYAGGTEPAAWTVAAGADLTVPVVPGEAVTASTVPVGPAIGIGVVLAVALLAWGGAALVRRRGAAAHDPDPTAPPLEIRDLAKTYRGGFSAVQGVSFRVEPGQVLGLLGPNGAGKTTVLRMLMGLIRPTAGTITAFGEPVGPGAPVLARIGAFVEGPGFLPHLSGADNLRLYWAATGRPTAEAHLPEALEIAGLGASVERRVGTYSQGMRQRLAIAQAMLGLPELLVLDEPTNGLDPPQIHAMREVLRRYAAGGRTVLVSSHLLAEVEQTCDHVVVMHHGKVVADGSVDDIIGGGGAATFAVDAPDRAADVLGRLDGVHAVEVDGASVHAELNGTPRASAVRALVTAGVDVASAGPRRRLEDAFLQLVGEDSGS